MSKPKPRHERRTAYLWWRWAQLGALMVAARLAWRHRGAVVLGSHVLDRSGQRLLVLNGVSAESWDVRPAPGGERFSVKRSEVRRAPGIAQYVRPMRYMWTWWVGYHFETEVGRRMGCVRTWPAHPGIPERTGPYAYSGTAAVLRRRHARNYRKYIRQARAQR